MAFTLGSLRTDTSVVPLLEVVTLELVADEVKSWRYQRPTDTAPAYGTFKFNLGRGVTFHTAGLILRNRQGGNFSLGGMEPIIETLRKQR